MDLSGASRNTNSGQPNKRRDLLSERRGVYWHLGLGGWGEMKGERTSVVEMSLEKGVFIKEWSELREIIRDGAGLRAGDRTARHPA